MAAEFGLPYIEWLAFRWKRREPLTETWKELAGDDRKTALAFWFRAAETDAWTFDELRRLLDQCIDAKDVPLSLQAWGLDVAAGRKAAPVRRGRPTDYQEDLIVMISVVLRQHHLGETLHAACQAVAINTNRSYEAVRAAFDRGNKPPPGL